MCFDFGKSYPFAKICVPIIKFTFPSTIFFIIELKFSRFENVSLDKFSIIEFGNIF